MSNKKSPIAFDTFSDGDILTYLWVGTGISYSMSLACLVDLSIDAYVRESSPSDVCETDSFIQAVHFGAFQSWFHSPQKKIDWAHPFKVTSGKLSRKSRFFCVETGYK